MTGKLTHHMEQLGAGMSEFARSVLAPVQRTMIDEGFPPELVAELLVALQSEFLALTLEQTGDDGAD